MAKKKLTTCKACGAEIARSAKSCPHCGAKNKKSVFTKWWFWLIIIIIIVATLGGNGTNSGEATSGKSSAQSSTSTETTIPVEYTTVSVSQMMQDLKGNAMKAQNAYKNQYLEITGKLSNIDSDGKYISLTPSDDIFAIIGVHCTITSDMQKAQVMNMKEGDIVTLRGKCTDVGEVMGYTLKIESIDGYDASSTAAKETTDGWIVCDAGTLIKELSENAMKAQTMYKGQKVSVTGKLSNIDSNGKYISIDGTDNTFSLVNIRCEIKNDEIKTAVLDLTIGDIITIKGTCKDVGEIMGYTINIEALEK